jgi:hypothetical protein
MLLKRGLEETGLLWRRRKVHNDRSFHTESISYTMLICQEATVDPVAQAPKKGMRTHRSHAWKGRGLRALLVMMKPKQKRRNNRCKKMSARRLLLLLTFTRE